jgi:two-component system, OmpR family, sensor histidine kinase BaeS
MKLGRKLFVVFLCTSILMITLMLGIMQYLSNRYFADYAAKSEMARLSGICEALRAEYRQHNGWDNIRDNSLLWDQIILKHQPPGTEDEPPPRIGPPPPGMPRYEDPNRPLPPAAPILTRRLTLYDGQKRFVRGRRGVQPQNQDLIELTVDGSTVGWVGLSRSKVLTNRLQLDYIYEEKRAYILVGSAILIMATLISFILSRYLLRPIQQLMAGTNALALRRFDTRLDIQSRDELGTLGANFNTMAETLEKYESIRNQWIADIAHELRTPLTILRGDVEAILDGVRDMNREKLESVHVEVMLLSKLIDDLHALTIIESEALTLAQKPANLLAIAASTLNLFQPRFSQMGIEMQNDLGKNEGSTIMGDSDRLVQMFTNIYENTLRYTDSPGILRIHSEERGNCILLRIEDSAPGVPDAAMPLIFDRLYRADRSRSRKKGGCGLGMAITKAIVDAHGGQITASPSPLGGLRIEIAMPLVKVG